jgi:hypothetical protein
VQGLSGVSDQGDRHSGTDSKVDDGGIEIIRVKHIVHDEGAHRVGEPCPDPFWLAVTLKHLFKDGPDVFMSADSVFQVLFDDVRG